MNVFTLNKNTLEHSMPWQNVAKMRNQNSNRRRRLAGAIDPNWAKELPEWHCRKAIQWK